MRLFIAVNSDENINRSLSALSPFFSGAVKGRAVPPERRHLTLVFLGEQSGAKRAVKAMDALSFEPFVLTVSGIGRFRRPKGDILWAGVNLSPELLSLQKRLCESLMSVGIPVEKRGFRPHITIARDVKTADDFDMSSLDAAFAPCRTEVRRVSLMKSEFTAAGPLYTEIYARCSGGEKTF